MNKIQKYIIVFLVLVIAFGIYLIVSADRNNWKAAKGNREEIIVDISGAVKKPGVYTFSSGSRVIDAINRAGGFAKKADLGKIASDINQASKLEDEQKILIPFKQDEAKITSTSGQSTNQQAVAASGVINLNQASQAQLESLSGIGPVYAARIIQLRNQLGSFTSLNQLLEVSGIGERTLEKIAPQVSL
jgi:competence protein ComEA